MAGGRLEILKSMVEQNPRDSFVRYGLAMEYKNAGDLESAVREFQTLLAADPNYAAAYFHAGHGPVDRFYGVTWTGSAISPTTS
jgi:tetratricopeptide (TPR) repeat protein